MKSYYSEFLPVNLRRLRHFQVYPQKYLAQQLGISQAAYSKMERGITRLSEIHLNRIAEIYSIEPFDVLLKSEEELIRLIAGRGIVVPPPEIKAEAYA